MKATYVRESKQSGISDSLVLDIRKAYASGATKTEIADAYGVDRKTIYNIVEGNTWTHVPSPRPAGSFKNYEVFPDGRVWSRNAGRFVSTRTRRDGTVVVELRNGDRRQSVDVALLVARAFVNKNVRTPSSIGYRDADSTNVHFSNLVVNSRKS